MVKNPAQSRTIDFFSRGAWALVFALCVAAAGRAQQEQPAQQQQDQQQRAQQQSQQGQQQEQGQQQGQDQQGTQDQPPQAQDSKPKPTYAPQDADKPPYSHDRPRRNSPAEQVPQSSQTESNQQAPSNQSYQEGQGSQPGPGNQTGASVPPMLTLPAGTILMVRINDFLSSDKNKIGDEFTAVLDQPLVVNGWVVARRGQTLVGKVKEAKKAGRVTGTSQLGVELTDLTVVDGRQVPILSEFWKASAGTSHGQDAATIGGTTALGAVIGSAADWGRGAAIGAGAGAVAGIAAVLLTRGHPTELLPETPLSFRLIDPVKVDTTQAQQAFLPVTQEDFGGGRGDHRRPRLAAGYPGPWGYPCGYYGPCYAYPGFVGIYSGYGWGPRYYGGFYGRHGYRY
jgi:hypothetical protein